MIHIPNDIADRIEKLPGGWEVSVRMDDKGPDPTAWKMVIAARSDMRQNHQGLLELMDYLEANHDDVDWKGNYWMVNPAKLGAIEAIVPDNWRQPPNRHDRCAHG